MKPRKGVSIALGQGPLGRRPVRGPGDRRPIELGETTVVPGPNGENEGGAVTRVPRAAIALYDVHAFPRCIAENPFPLCEGLIGYRATVEEELLIRAREMTGKEFPQQLLMNVLLHRTSRAPAEAP